MGRLKDSKKFAQLGVSNGLCFFKLYPAFKCIFGELRLLQPWDRLGNPEAQVGGWLSFS